MRFIPPRWVKLQTVVFERPGDEVSGLVIGKMFHQTEFGEVPVFLLYDSQEERIMLIQAFAKMLRDYLVGSSRKTGVRIGEKITIRYEGRKAKKHPPGTFYHVFRRTRSHFISKKYAYPEKT